MQKFLTVAALVLIVVGYVYLAAYTWEHLFALAERYVLGTDIVMYWLRIGLGLAVLCLATTLSAFGLQMIAEAWRHRQKDKVAATILMGFVIMFSFPILEIAGTAIFEHGLVLDRYHGVVAELLESSGRSTIPAWDELARRTSFAIYSFTVAVAAGFGALIGTIAVVAILISKTTSFVFRLIERLYS